MIKSKLIVFVVALVFAISNPASANQLLPKEKLTHGKPSTRKTAIYQSLDSLHPITFGGSYIEYNGRRIGLGPKAFFIDGQLADSIANKYPYVFNSINKAAEHLSKGTEADPMCLYIAPYVYWIDNPNDPEVRRPTKNGIPFGLEINCPYLQFNGLNPKPENIVLACNRGQTIGAKGNFTMLGLWGDGISAENITFGNYCNVDLEYPLKPELDRAKRASAIVQAQLVICNGDKIAVRNSQFISRLNLCPFVGGKRVFFDRCHFESTDDALCGTGVHLNCTFLFCSPKPFYHTVGTGAVFLNCDIKSLSGQRQYFTKAGGQLAVIDTRISTKPSTYVAWRDIAPLNVRNYQFNVHQNGKPLHIDKNNPDLTVNMAGKQVLNAYRFEYQNTVYYNTYNLLKGDDDWDPADIKPLVLAIEQGQGGTYYDIPVQLKINPTKKLVETNKDSLQFTAHIYRFGNFAANKEALQWSISEADKPYAKLLISADGYSCTLVPTNVSDAARELVVTAKSQIGLVAASVITVMPAILDAPMFRKAPRLTLSKKGIAQLSYALDTHYDDWSEVSWYRCTNEQGSNAIKSAVSRGNVPYVSYPLSVADVGYYLMAEIAPRHQRSEVGKPVRIVYPKVIKPKHVTADPLSLTTKFKNLATDNQPKIIPGFWTLDYLEAEDTGGAYTTDYTKDAWYFGAGHSGAAKDTGLIQSWRRASLLYTPVHERTSNMELDLVVSPFKSAGQGFSIADLYMDVLIKFDTKTMSGYALRLIRTTKFGNAIDCYFVEYKDGKATQIGDAVTTSAYRSPCHIKLRFSGETLSAQLSTTFDLSSLQYPVDVLTKVDIRKFVKTNSFGGVGVLHNGGSATLLKELKVVWSDK